MNRRKSRNERDILEELFELGSILSQQVDFEEIVRIVTHKASQILHSDFASVVMVNPKTQDTIKTIHKIANKIHPPHFHRVQNQVSGWILYHNKPLLSQNIKRDERFKKVKLQDVAISSVIGVPLVIEGANIGSLILFNQASDKIFNEEDLSNLEKAALIVAPYLKNVEKLQQFFQLPMPMDALISKYARQGLIGKSEPFVNLLKSVDAAARSDVRVLLEGETGTGKELVAKAIHRSSSRSAAPFVALDCGAISPQLLESELFGHTRGSFTGATQERKGLFQQAHNGTLFLDEIGNLTKEMQTKLLRVLQENEIRPVGSDVTIGINVRAITAVSKSLRSLVEEDLFREDLFFRLHVYPIPVPNLADRRADIPLLANHFLKKYSEQQNKKVELFHSELIEFMKYRQWPGNIRELENFVERLVTLCERESKILPRKVLPPDMMSEFKAAKLDPVTDNNLPLQHALSNYEKELLLRALEQSRWNQSEAARMLQIAEGTLRYKMKQLGISKQAYQSVPLYFPGSA